MSRAAAASRHSQRDTGRFASQATLRAQQRALLAPSSRWRKEWVKPSINPGEQSSYKVLKWVKFDEGGDMAEEWEQPTEEQVTAAITGAKTLLEPENNAESMSAAGTPSGLAGTPAPVPAQSAAPADMEVSPVAAATSNTAPLTQSSQAGQGVEEPLPGLEDQIPPTGHSNITSNFEAKPSAAADGGGGETNAIDSSLLPGREDDGGDMQMEMEQREHDVRLAPELVGKEGEEARAALGISDPIQGGPPEITG